MASKLPVSASVSCLRRAYARVILPEELKNWIVHEDKDLLVINKPGDVVCHPSKAGPWSSLAGAVREYAGLAASHLVTRLDRETSGLVLFAKTVVMARRLQNAMSCRRIGKAYLAILAGELAEPMTVAQPLGKDDNSRIVAKFAVRGDGQAAVTHFVPLSSGGGFTLVRVVTETGRKHQIRVHAQWLGRSLVGDKIYGPDERCFLDFLDRGWVPELAEKLLMRRQALHCSGIDLRKAGIGLEFSAPMPEDMRLFCGTRGIDMSESAVRGTVPDA